MGNLQRAIIVQYLRFFAKYEDIMLQIRYLQFLPFYLVWDFGTIDMREKKCVVMILI